MAFAFAKPTRAGAMVAGVVSGVLVVGGAYLFFAARTPAPRDALSAADPTVTLAKDPSTDGPSLAIAPVEEQKPAPREPEDAARADPAKVAPTPDREAGATDVAGDRPDQDAPPPPVTDPGAKPAVIEAADAPAAAAPDSVASTDVSEAAAPSDETAADDRSPAAPADNIPPADPQVMAPQIDVVRIEADGNALIAGRAAPGSEVSVLLDRTDIAAVRAGADGGFVALLEIPPSQATRTLSLESAVGDFAPVVSANTVIVVPQDPVADSVADPQVAARHPQPGTGATATPPAEPTGAGPSPHAGGSPAPGSRPDAGVAAAPRIAALAENDVSPPALPAGASTALQDAGRAPDPAAGPVEGASPPSDLRQPPAEVAAQMRGGDAPATPAGADAPDAPATAADGPAMPDAAPRLLVADADGVRVLQDPGPAPRALSNVVIDSIGYDRSGDVVLGGRGTGAGFVRLYLDNRAIMTVPVAPNGQWRADLPAVDSRVYTLRVDEVDEDGDVTSRAETPFKPASAAELAELPDAAQRDEVSAVTVQPGFTLWRIARERYGQGVLYVRVFEANADKIRDPDLIYPGQVFAIPD
ncbi:LysM peptidoglycan-binding domain-containing protein [Oceaniglobus indicus]|uniref:LysM peptidoglycan-binding domain-containing protein n=1 Tax=Oceaniglobus indicus TaxID=2047749 RepID=UPI0011AB36AD|nr:LysM peptidoglycan-binding domain-containing protein [Oceaniglobus indicus]